MLPLLFQCIACREGAPLPDTAPLCSECATSLLPAPALCPHCAGPACPQGECSRPWVCHPGIDSFAARYVCVEPGYRVLRRWKVTQGPALDRRVLTPDPRLLEHWSNLGLDAVTWVPQRIERSWRLGSCPAEKVARWVARQTGLPALAALAPANPCASASRQAERGMQDRLSNRLAFEWIESVPLRRDARILLVDDFMTSGRTLRAAAQALRSRGAFAVHVFCLGVRPFRGAGDAEVVNVDGRHLSLGEPERASHLSQGA